MKDIYTMQQELVEVNKELIVLCTEDCNLFRKGCLGRNSKRVNELGTRKYNLQININQVKQIQ